MDDDISLQARKEAAQELGLSIEEPVFYEYSITRRSSYWQVVVLACSLDGRRNVVVVWNYSGLPIWWLQFRAKRMCNKLAKEQGKGIESRRVWVQ